MNPCATEHRARSMIRGRCSEDDVIIIKHTSNRYKKLNSVSFTSEEQEDIRNSSGNVYIGIFYSNGFTDYSRFRCPMLEVWPAMNKNFALFLSTTGECTISLSQCCSGNIPFTPISSHFDCYWDGSLSQRYYDNKSITNTQKLSMLVQLRLELLFTCKESYSALDKLAGMGAIYKKILEISLPEFVFYDLLSFEILVEAVARYSTDINEKCPRFIDLWLEMELDLLKYRFLNSYTTGSTGDLSKIVQGFLSKIVNGDEDRAYSFDREEMKLLPSEDANFLCELLDERKEQNNHSSAENELSTFEAISFAYNFCMNKLSLRIRSAGHSNTVINCYLKPDIIINAFSVNEFHIGIMLGECRDKIMKYYRERVTVTIGNRLVVYSDPSSSSSNVKKISSALEKKKSAMPQCMKKILDSDEGYKNSFIFNYLESVEVDIEDVVSNKPPQWRKSLQNTKKYLETSGKEPFNPNCGWLMKNGFCCHLNKSTPDAQEDEENEEKKENADNQVKYSHKRKPIEIEVSKSEWVETVKRCKVDRNYGLVNPNSELHNSPVQFTKQKEIGLKSSSVSSSSNIKPKVWKRTTK